MPLNGRALDQRNGGRYDNSQSRVRNGYIWTSNNSSFDLYHLKNQDPFLGLKDLDLLRIYSFLSRKSWSSIVISWSITYILYTHIANFQTLLCDSSDFLEEKKIRILAAQGDRTKFLCKFISGWDIPLWILEKTKKSSFLSILFSIDLTTIDLFFI